MLLRIATRRSKLALAQSHWIKARLESLRPGLTVELREFVTRGDRIQDVPLSQVGGKGLFTKEIEEALLREEADLAVHSLKDLPSELPPGLMLGAVPEREDPRDALVLPAEPGLAVSPPPSGEWGRASAGDLDLVPHGARVGSSSLRRASQVKHLRPDLVLDDVRGNVDTRLRKLDEGQYGALILAAAGLNRLGLSGRISAALAPEISTPAPGQGALGIECRSGDTKTRELLDLLDHAPTRCCVTAERAVMDTIGGGCSIPLGALARIEGEKMQLIALVAAPDGSRLLRETLTGLAADAEALGREAAELLLAAGARTLLG